MSEKNPENNQIPEGPKLPPNNENKEVKETPEQKAQRTSMDQNERSERQHEAEESLQTLFDSKSETKKEASLPENNIFTGTPVDKDVKYFTSDTPSRLGENFLTDTAGLFKGTFDSAITTGKLALDTVADTARLALHPIREIRRTRAYLKSLDEVETKV